jgi:hypothetical protein
LINLVLAKMRVTGTGMGTYVPIGYGDGDNECHPLEYGDGYGYFFKPRIWG